MSENGMLKPNRNEETRLAEMEEKIRARVRALFDAMGGEFVPEHSRAQAVISLLYEYATKNPNNLKYGSDEHGVREYGYEIFKTCVDVLKAYTPGEGDFIHYFNAAIAATLTRCSGKHAYEKMHQVNTISNNKVRTISDLVRRVREASGSGDVTAECVIEMAQKMGKRVSIHEVQEYMDGDLQMDRPAFGEPGSATIGEQLEDSSMSPEDVALNAFGPDGVARIVTAVDRAFLSTQERQRGYLREALTAKLSESLAQAVDEDEGLQKTLEETSWFDPETFDLYVKTGEKALQKDIAARHEVSEVGLSVAMKKLLTRLKEELDRPET